MMTAGTGTVMTSHSHASTVTKQNYIECSNLWSDVTVMVLNLAFLIIFKHGIGLFGKVRPYLDKV